VYRRVRRPPIARGWEGVRDLKDTVDAALKEVVASAARRADARRLREMRGLDLDRPEIMEQAWR